MFNKEIKNNSDCLTLVNKDPSLIQHCTIEVSKNTKLKNSAKISILFMNGIEIIQDDLVNAKQKEENREKTK